jgi:hypothetical protein
MMVTLAATSQNGRKQNTLGIYAPIDEGKEGPQKKRDEAMGFSQTQTPKKKKDKQLLFLKRKRKRDYPYL